MKQDEKEKIRAAAERVAVGAFVKAKVLTGWRKWLALAVGTLAAGAAAWLMSGCAAVVKQDEAGFSARWVLVLPVEK